MAAAAKAWSEGNIGIGGAMSKLAMRAAGLAGMALVLSGCAGLGNSDAGGAAARSSVGIVGQDQLIAAIQAFQTEVGLPANQPADTLAKSTLQRMVQDMLLQAQADRLGVKVTQAQIDDGLAKLAAQYGGASGLADAAHSSGLAVSEVPSLVRSNLLFAGISAKMSPGTDSTTGAAVVQNAVTALSDEANVTVAPRYGVWDDATLSIQATSTVTQSEPPAKMSPTPEASPSAPAESASPQANPAESATPSEAAPPAPSPSATK
jgi:hypothetical protein